MAWRIVIPSFGRVSNQALTAAPKPYQAGSIKLHCAQLNTHGLARRSSIRADDLRDDGRLPMFRLAISSITVDSRKKRSKPSVSYTRLRYARYASAARTSIA